MPRTLASALRVRIVQQAAGEPRQDTGDGMSASVLQFPVGMDTLVRQVTARLPEPATGRDRGRHRAGACVLGARVFRDALVRERKRADRLASPFAVLVVDCSHRPADEATWASIVRAAAFARRDVDAVGWLEQGAVLAVLMPGASRQVASKVARHLGRQIARRLGDDAAAALSMRLYGHGFEVGAGGADLPARGPADRRVRPRDDTAGERRGQARPRRAREPRAAGGVLARVPPGVHRRQAHVARAPPCSARSASGGAASRSRCSSSGACASTPATPSTTTTSPGSSRRADRSRATATRSSS